MITCEEPLPYPLPQGVWLRPFRDEAEQRCGQQSPFFFICVSRFWVRDGINVTCLYSKTMVWVWGSALGERRGSQGLSPCPWLLPSPMGWGEGAPGPWGLSPSCQSH